MIERDRGEIADRSTEEEGEKEREKVMDKQNKNSK